MASLANQTISSTYDGLIKTSTDQPVGVSGVQLLEDGVGNTLALSVGRANQGVTVTGTLTATTLTGTVSATSVLADGVTATTQSAGDNSTKVATTAYVDAQVTAEDLDFAGDAGTGAVDLDSQTFTIAGTANEIETSASGQTITIGLPSSVTVGTLNATTLAGTLSTAAQTNITSVGTLSSLAVSGDLTVDTSTLKVDSANNRIGIGTASPVSALHINSSENVRITGILSSSNPALFIPTGGILGDNGSDFFEIRNGGDSSSEMRVSSRGFVSIYTSGAGDLGTGSERMRIDSSGNVKIGDANPDITSTLTVSSNGSTNVATFMYDGTAGTYFDIDCEDADGIVVLKADARSGAYPPLSFVTGGSERMRIDASGNVGIGTSSPTGGLFVAKQTATNYSTEVGVSLGATSNTGAVEVFGATNGASLIDFSPTDGVTDFSGRIFYEHANDFMTFATDGSERMRIDSSGNVGIGTSSPTDFVSIHRSSNSGSGSQFSRVSIQNDLATQGDGTTTYNFADLRVAAGAGAVTMVFQTTYAQGTWEPSGIINLATNHPLRFNTNNTERMRITSGGDIEIKESVKFTSTGGSHYAEPSTTLGTTTNGTKFQLYSDGSSYDGQIGIGSFANMWFKSQASSSSNGRFDFYGSSNAQLNLRINGDGSTQNRTGVWGSSLSDLRLKENVTDASNKLEDILSLKVKNFNYIDESEKLIGFIAQEFEEVFPSLVTTYDSREYDEDGNVISGFEDQKGLKVGMDFAILTKAIQEQQEIINDLKARIETLENN